jgi:transcriptional accessory protein Tex/SPT6
MSGIGMEESTFRQCAGFLRIPAGENALDRTAVHPESYPIVEKMAASLNVGIAELIGNKELIGSLKIDDFITESAGIPTLNDIREELMRPGRDPRKSFKVPQFRADVREMSDLKPGMTLEGTVTNVTNFGAFVDIGVRQDGLVHLSQMSNRFIRDPREAVKVGDVVQVKVISVETETKRIGLSIKALLPTLPKRRKKQQPHRPGNAPAQAHRHDETVSRPADAQAASTEREPGAGGRPKPNRPHEGPRHKKRPDRKPERTKEGAQDKDLTPKGPEPSLQEKIAILQSKFRRIN